MPITERIQIIHDLPKAIINLIKELGTVVTGFDEYENRIYYYNLPQWFKEVNGHTFGCPFDELPKAAQEIHLAPIKKLDPEDVYDLEQIQKLCTNYDIETIFGEDAMITWCEKNGYIKEKSED